MKRLFALLTIPMLLAADWPQWRGPNADGLSSETGFPTEWDGASGKNIKWKVKLTGVGNSSPVIHGLDLLITSTSGRDHSELSVHCFDPATGKEKWTRSITATPADAPFSMFPPERGHAASTLVVTDDAIFALFGTGDLLRLDRKGKPVWMRSLTTEFGAIRNDYGIAASPIVIDGNVVVQIDHLGGSYLLAADPATGKTRWKTSRNLAFDNWATPVAYRSQGGTQVICLGTKLVVGYDLGTGKQLWSVEGLERLCSCTPILKGDKLYAVSGPNGASLAIDLAAKPTPKSIWQSKKTGPFVPSGIVVDELYFVANDQGTATCYDTKTGEDKWKERVSTGRMRPSPVAADGMIYFTALDGSTTIIKASDDFQVVAKNKLDEDVAASFALSGGKIYIRGDKHLWCVGK